MRDVKYARWFYDGTDIVLGWSVVNNGDKTFYEVARITVDEREYGTRIIVTYHTGTEKVYNRKDVNRAFLDVAQHLRYLQQVGKNAASMMEEQNAEFEAESEV